MGCVYAIIASAVFIGCDETPDINIDASVEQLASKCIKYVDDDADDNGDGNSWSSAFNRVTLALDATSEETGAGACEVWVREGTSIPEYIEIINGHGTVGNIDLFTNLKGNETPEEDMHRVVESGSGAPNISTKETIASSDGANLGSPGASRDRLKNNESVLETMSSDLRPLSFSESSYLRAYGTSSTPDPYFWLDSYDSTDWAIHNIDGNMRIAADNSTKIYIDSDGNVGIGTGATAPVSKLEVNGRLELPADDAQPTAGNGSIEIGNGLQIDNNEILVPNGTLYLQNDSNRDLRVDGDTLVVDADTDRVGINTTAPQGALSIDVSSGVTTAVQVTGFPNDSGQTNLLTQSANRNQWLWKLNGTDAAANFGIFMATAQGAEYQTGKDTSNPNEIVFVGNSGTKVAAIDLDTGDGYFEEVHAKEITVSSDWADYVFEDDYNLRSLNEVEEFIADNGHLPDVPPAAVVQKEGISLGVSQANLLRKIEELTLYVIAQNKEIEKMRQRLDRRDKQ